VCLCEIETELLYVCDRDDVIVCVCMIEIGKELLCACFCELNSKLLCVCFYE